MFGEVTTALIKIFIEIKHSMSVFGCFFTCRLPLDNVEAGISCNIMSALHTDPELQAIVQGLEVSSPSFRAILGVLFCDYDVSQGLRG